MTWSRPQRDQQVINVQFDHDTTVYTYVWGADEEIQVGDKVVTPSWLPSTHPGFGTPGVATVCAVGDFIPPDRMLFGRFTSGPVAVTVLTEKLGRQQTPDQAV